MKKKTKGIIVLTVVAIFGFTTLAFAGWGNGCNYGMGRDNRSANMDHRGGSGHGQGQYYGNLSEQEIAKIEQQRTGFFKATENNRQMLYEKELALRSELAKENPDTSKASNLQSEISKLQSDLDQTRLDYQIQARKSVPNYGRGDSGYGHMMGNGPRGDRYCMW